MLNICGCLVQAMPDTLEQVVSALGAMEGVDVHAHQDGQVVVTVEDTTDKRASEQIMDMHQIPGVLTVTLTYHHFEPLGQDTAAAHTL